MLISKNDFDWPSFIFCTETSFSAIEFSQADPGECTETSFSAIEFSQADIGSALKPVSVQLN